MPSGAAASPRPDLLAAVLDSLPAHTAVLDPDGRIVAVSRSWRRFALDNGGSEPTCGVGADYLAVCRAATGRDLGEASDVADGIRAACSGEVEQFTMDYECSSPDEQRWFQVSVVPLRGGSGEARRLGAVVSHTDITPRKLDELDRVHEATHDPQTGLPGRAVLLAQLRCALLRARVQQTPLALVHLDVDGVTTVSDTLGREAGDRLLLATVDRLRPVLRPGQLLARTGRDELVALLPGTGVVGARRCARRMAEAVAEPVEVDGLPVVLSSRTGIAVSDEGPDLAEDLLAEADAALRRARRRGRSRSEVPAGHGRARAQRRADVEEQLEVALDDGSLQLFRQPVVRLVDGTQVGSEALARWFPPAGGIRSAASFMDEVTHSRVRAVVADAILRCALAAMADEQGVVGVNVSLPELVDGSLVRDVEEVLRVTGCPPSRLSLEVAEPLLCSATTSVRRTLAGLDGLGVGLVVDHVSGQVPAATVAALPLRGVKVDRGLVVGDTEGAAPGRHAVLRSLVALADDLGLELSAVGVETEVERRRLVDEGVLLGQGWRLGPPTPWVTVRRRPPLATRRFAAGRIPG